MAAALTLPMQQELLEHFERLLTDASPPETVRAMEKGAAADGLWAALHESGFMDALLPESDGGSGLSLQEICPLLMAAGRCLLPVPFAQTMVARALLAQDSCRPVGPVVLVAPTVQADGYIQRSVPLADVAKYALVEIGEHLILTEVAPARVAGGPATASRAADLV